VQTWDYPPTVKVLHTIPLQVGVRGIAILDSSIYVALHETSSIHIYDIANYQKSGEINVEGLVWPVDMVADKKGRCLYVSDRYGKDKKDPALYRINLENLPQSKRILLPDERSGIPAQPCGVSMTKDGKLLVICEGRKEFRSLRVFSRADGSSMEQCDRIDLSSLERYLLQAIELEGNRFAITQVHKGSNLHRIVIIGVDNYKKGMLRGEPYGGHGPLCWPQIRFPWSILLDRNGRILANDCHYHKIILLSEDLQFLRYIFTASDVSSASDKIVCPRHLCLDEELGLCFIGRRWKCQTEVSMSTMLGAVTVLSISDDRDGQ